MYLVKPELWLRKFFRVDPLEYEPLHIFLTGNAGYGKSFLMRVIYHSLIETLSY